MDHKGVIDSFGGPPQFAAAIGIEESHARAMKARNSISPDYWPRVVAEARARRIRGISMETLAAMRAARFNGRGSASAQVAIALVGFCGSYLFISILLGGVV